MSSADDSRPRTRWRQIKAGIPVLESCYAAVVEDDPEAYGNAVGQLSSLDISAFTGLQMVVSGTVTAYLMGAKHVTPDEIARGVSAWPMFLADQIDEGILASLLESASNPQGRNRRIDNLDYLDRYMRTGVVLGAYSLQRLVPPFATWREAFDEPVSTLHRGWPRYVMRRTFTIRDRDVRR